MLRRVSGVAVNVSWGRRGREVEKERKGKRKKGNGAERGWKRGRQEEEEEREWR